MTADTTPESATETIETAVEPSHSAAETSDDESGTVTADATTDGRDARRDSRTRAKLRDAETEIGRLRAALSPYVKTAVENVAADRLMSGASIWLLPGLDPLSLLDADLAPDDDAIDAAIERLLVAVPQLARHEQSFDGGRRGGPVDGKTPTWRELMSPKG